ncbi:MAG: alpha/beta fold hydrolase [Candidatus Eisenbacteria bacterium]|nr:alpha/beta fold hydrolase [Candidatus Eisenbacteria bacterium]
MPWRESAADLDRARAERPIVVPSAFGGLVGIYTPAAPDVPSAGLCAVLLTRPRSHRNRMWVEGARRLAAQGFACFRFDYHGTGDSEGPTGPLDPNRPYRDDIVTVLRVLRAQLGGRRFVLCGACFDARTALSAFADEADAIAGLMFMAAPVVELDTLVRVDADRKDWGHLARSLRNPYNWKSLASAGRWRYMATVIGRVARRSLGAAPAGDPPLGAAFVEHFQALLRSRARALFLYGRDDAEYESFRIAERTAFAKLTPEQRARLEVEVWDGTVHGFLEMKRQRETFERALGWIAALHPARAAAPARTIPGDATPSAVAG